jgi:hypothetical protein
MDEGQVITLINAAFANVPRPAKESITGCTCGECLEIREDFAERDPDDLAPDKMRFHSWDMTFLTPEARHYFIPGWMRLSIRQPDSAYTDAVIELLLSGEGWDVPRRYTLEQHQAIVNFLDLIRIRNAGYNEDLEAVWRCWTEPAGDGEIPHRGVGALANADSANGPGASMVEVPPARIPEEPGAVIPHAGICEGGVGQPASLP